MKTNDDVLEVVEETKVKSVKQEEPKYEKSAIIESKKYRKYIDILNVKLEDKEYTLSEVDKIIDDYINKEVD